MPWKQTKRDYTAVNQWVQISNIRFLDCLTGNNLKRGEKAGATCSPILASPCGACPLPGSACLQKQLHSLLNTRFLPLFSSLWICKIFKLLLSHVGHENVMKFNLKRRNAPSAAVYSSILSSGSKRKNVIFFVLVFLMFKRLCCQSWHWI